jgi:hypothetical protein
MVARHTAEARVRLEAKRRVGCMLTTAPYVLTSLIIASIIPMLSFQDVSSFIKSLRCRYISLLCSQYNLNFEVSKLYYLFKCGGDPDVIHRYPVLNNMRNVRIFFQREHSTDFLPPYTVVVEFHDDDIWDYEQVITEEMKLSLQNHFHFFTFYPTHYETLEFDGSKTKK